MTEEQIKKLISDEIKKEKKSLAIMMKMQLQYTGQYAKASHVIDVINKWSQ